MKIRSKSPTRRVITGDRTYLVDPGETVDVPDDLADRLLEQTDRWEPADDMSCDGCGFVAKTPGGLASHQRTHEEQP